MANDYVCSDCPAAAVERALERLYKAVAAPHTFMSKTDAEMALYKALEDAGKVLGLE